MVVVFNVFFSLLGDNGIITVSDLKNHCVRMVTSSGKFLDYIGSEVHLIVLCTVLLLNYVIYTWCILSFQFLSCALCVCHSRDVVKVSFVNPQL